MKRISLILSLLLVVSFSSLAMADEGTSGFYVGILGGYMMPKDVTMSPKDGTPSADISLDKGYHAGAKVGYIPSFAKYLAMELEYNYSKTSFDNGKSYGGNKLDGTNSMNAFFLNFKLRYPEGSFHPYIGIGPGYSWFKQGDITGSGIGGGGVAAGDTSSQFAYQFLAGLDYDITKNWGVGLGYKYLQVKPSFGGALNVDYNYTAHIVTLGVNYSF
jgi:opacity protein-like surface antigen